MRRAVLICLLAVLLLPATAHAAPSHNGKITYTAAGDIWSVNPNGTGAANLTNTAAAETCALLSPRGDKIAFRRGGIRVMEIDGTADYELTPYDFCIEDWYPDGNAVTFTSGHAYASPCDGEGGVWNEYLDGRDRQQVACGPPCQADRTPDDPDWAPDGRRLAAVGCPFESFPAVSDLGIVPYPNGTVRMLTNTPGEDDPSQWEYEPDFSPDGTSIVFGLDGDAYRINTDGTDQRLLATEASVPVWSPDGTQLAFSKAGDVWTMSPDGSNQDNLTNNPGGDFGPVWSPDGQRLAFMSNRDGDQDVYVMNRDGSGVSNVTNTSGVDESAFGWAAPTGYPRPAGATPLHVSLVTAYDECTAPNRTHGPPLDSPSCNPPTRSSDHLTVGTADSNGQVVRYEGHLRLNTILGNPSTPADEADVGIDFFSKGVLTNALDNYIGELRAEVPLRIIDRYNTPNPSAATTPDFTFNVDATCAVVPDPSPHSVCQTTTTVDALIPGLIRETQRTIWQLGQVVVYDGGPDGDTSTVTGNTLFARQGVFIP